MPWRCPRAQTLLPSLSTSSIIARSSDSDGFWPRALIITPSSWFVMWPSPSLSNKEKATRNSTSKGMSAGTHSWWSHKMETFCSLLALCEGNPLVTGGFPSHKPVTHSFDVFFDLRLNKRLSKQWRRLWFETPSRSLWRHCNDTVYELTIQWYVVILRAKW